MDLEVDPGLELQLTGSELELQLGSGTELELDQELGSEPEMDAGQVLELDSELN